MKLISENSYEDQVLHGLVALLRDLNVNANGFVRSDAVAPIFWSPEDFTLSLPALKDISKGEMSAMLEDLEPDLQSAMILAGFNVIDNALRHASGAKLMRHHRLRA